MQCNSAHLIIVDEAESQQRIDNFLLRVLKKIPPSHIYRILRRGEVRVNSGRVRQTYRLQAGDRIRIPPLWTDPPLAPPPPQLGVVLLQRALYEDDALLIIDKPTGIAVHGGSGIAHGIIERLRSTRREWSQLELAHRLDRETSGCLMLAKRRHALRKLHQSLREHQVKKHYLVLVRDAWSGGARWICQPLLKRLRRSGERIVRVSSLGKPTATRVTVVNTVPTASLLNAQPLTGKTHQIRVHLASSGHPIAGDQKYGDDNFNRDLQAIGLRRLFLHAHRLELPHPITGKPLIVEAPLPPVLMKVLRQIGIEYLNKNTSAI